MAGRSHLLERRLVELRVTGPELSHTRANNLEAIDRLLAGDPYLTFGIDAVVETVRSGRLTRESVLQSIAQITKCSSDMLFESGLGFISPAATVKGLRLAGTTLSRVAKGGGTMAFGTGHPGSLLQFYIELVSLVRQWGGRIAIPSGMGKVTDKLYLDFVGSVAVASDICGAPHTHESALMERFLATQTASIDLVVADHGFLAPALNRGIPSIAVMDTNDPAIAIARNLGANVVVIPMNDNRPNYIMAEAANVIRHMI